MLADKGTKLAVGVLAAERHAPHHLMVVADDVVSNRLAGFVNQHARAAGWYVDEGLVYAEGKGLVRRVHGFNGMCGTSVILRRDLLDAPDLPLTASQDDLREGFGAFQVRELLGSHKTAVTHFAARGEPLAPLPFPGAGYVLGTGENHSGGSLQHFALPVSKTMAEEFGLPRSSTSPRVIREVVTLAAAAARRRHPPA